MSLMHQALDRPPAQSPSRSSGYNPLQRGSRRSQTVWWLLAAAGFMVTLVILVWPLWSPATDPARPVLTQEQPGASSLTPEPPATAGPAQPAASLAESGTTTPIAEPEVAQASLDKSEPSERLEPLPAALPISNPQAENADSITEATNSATQAAGNGKPETESANKQAATTPPIPEREAVAPVATEELPVRADTPDTRAPKATKVADRADTTSAPSSVATAIPQHAAVREAVQTAIARGDMTLAQQRLQSWINREPQLEEPHVWLAKVYLNQGDVDEAETLLIGLHSHEALGLRGLILEQTGRYADAARVFEALSRDETRNPQWWLHWAINLENSGRLAEARLLYQTYLEQFSSHNARLTAFATERYQALAG